MQRDPAYLLDMLQAAQEVRGLSEGLTWDRFQQSRLHQLALVRLLEVIGEAARAVTEETKTTNPQIPWVPIILMRNHLVHRYFRIDLPQVWEVIQNHIDPLIANLEPLIGPNLPPQ